MRPNLEQAVLGLELGSTRIKAVLIDGDHKPIASGGYAWENVLEDGVWTYHMDEVLKGLRDCYRSLAEDVEQKFGRRPRRFAAMGISGMMHGYLVFGKSGELLTPFRTWRNTITGQAAAELTEKFRFNIPQRWSAAHLYQAILNGEPHVKDIALLTTLSGYIHLRLTGRNVVGVGEASGMFPYDQNTGDFDADKVRQFDELTADRGYPWKLRDILPGVLPAGAEAGTLTEEGAALLDETGTLQPGIPLCPPEGDAGTGMAATGAVLPRTGSVSAGTSAFALLVLEEKLKGCYPEIDVVATPSGKPTALIHTNTCTSDLDAWVRLFAQFYEAMGQQADLGELFPMLYRKALEGATDCGGLVAFNYYSGEPISHTEAGRPMLVRLPDSELSLANLMRAHLYSAIATLKLGIDLLAEQEHVETDRLLGHGGFFKTQGVGQQVLADALEVPISTMATAGEGGPWGMALLAAYMCRKRDGESMEDYLSNRVFAGADTSVVQPDAAGVEGFRRFLVRYIEALPAERAAGAIKSNLRSERSAE